jgi:hypothetical protein
LATSSAHHLDVSLIKKGGGASGEVNFTFIGFWAMAGRTMLHPINAMMMP